MQFQFNGDGKGFDFRVKVTWRALMALLAAIGVLAPAVARLGSILGWW